MKGMATVFVVDDEPILHKLYHAILEREGHSVVADAYNGVEAVEMYKRMNKKPDVILMDYRMPLKNGIEATKEIVEFDGDTRIVFVSADDTIKEDVIAAGACSFRLKTFKVEELIEDIEHAMSTRTVGA